jgi:hypothetical protein
MPLGSGLAAQVAIAKETTPGTRVPPTDGVEILSEGVKLLQERIERNGLKAGRRVSHGWSPGSRRIEGGLRGELSAETVGLFFELLMGGVNTTGSGPYTHEFTPDDLASATVQIGRPQLDGTVVPFDYLGMYVNSMSLQANLDEFVTYDIDWMGILEDLGQSLVTPTFGQSTFFTYSNGYLQVDGGSDVCVDTVTVNLENNLESHVCMKSTNPGAATPREAERRTYGGTFTGDWVSLADYQRFVNGTEHTLTLVFDAGANAQLTISGNVRFDGETPEIAGPEVLKHEQQFMFTSGTDDATALTITLINDDSTP